jgi:hydrogenase small subunit
MEFPAIWLQLSCCSGCSVSVLNAESPGIKNILIDQVVPGRHVSLRFHPTIMAGSGQAALEVTEGAQQEGGFLLVVEGSVPTRDEGVYGGVGTYNGEEVTMLEKTVNLARAADAVVALGTCAAFGGMFAAAPNPGGCKPVTEVLSEAGVDTPVINVPGCAPHPDWFVGTVARVLLGGLPTPEELDDLGRPKEFFGCLIHENCPRRAEFDAGKFAEKLGDDGCLYKLGCKGPVTYSDCPRRGWHGGTNWPIANNHPCIGCVEPDFPQKLAPFFVKITEKHLEEQFFISTK